MARKPLRAVAIAKPQAPAHLSEQAAGWWQQIADGWVLDESQFMLLTAAAEAFDRMTQARRALDEHGLVCEGRLGTRARPEGAVERDSRLVLARLIKQLDLEAPTSTAGPLALRPRRRDHR